MGQHYEHRVRDPIHSVIRFSEAERQLIDSLPFPRLRRIRQLALTSYVHPGATHTRLEHTLGVLELVTGMSNSIKDNTRNEIWHEMVVRSAKEVGLSEDEALQVLRLAALLHDVGHMPFSHAAEGILPEGLAHEDISVAIARSMSDFIDSLFFKEAADKAIQLIDPDEHNCPSEIFFLRQLLTGQIDADRCDYLMRDSLHCGVAYGQFDSERLLDSPTLIEDRGAFAVAVQRGGIHTVEALILARYFMFSQAYFHRTRRLFGQYLQEFLNSTLHKVEKNKLIGVLQLDDYDVMERVRECCKESASTPVKRLANILYYRGCDEPKHSMVYATHEFAGKDKEERIGEKVKGLQNRYPEYECIGDYDAKGTIHKFYCEADREPAGPPRLRVVTKGNPQSKWPYITKESRVIRDMPRKFWVTRVYTKVQDKRVREKPSKELQEAGEG